jgi:hypothetical protein
VDVRMIGDWADDPKRPSKPRVLSLAVTLWGRHVTGLPIDFQFQTTEAFHVYDTEARNPLGGRTRADWNVA